MSINITNTIPNKVNDTLNELKQRYENALKKANEHLRSEIVKPSTFPVKTGRLKESIGEINDINANNKGGFSYLGTKVKYAKFVEFGTSKMSARRFMQRGIDNAQDGIKEIIKNTLKVK